MFKIRYAFLLVFSAFYTVAQVNTVLVIDEQTQQAVEFASVRIRNDVQFTKEDGRAYFKQGIEEKSILTVRHLAYKTQKIEIDKNQSNPLIISLVQKENTLSEVVIKSGDFKQRLSNMDVSQLQITSKQLNAVPSLGGEKDLVKALMLMPGVKAVSEGSNAMFVRGGGADQNLLLLNQIPLYGSTHLFGLLSTFNSDIIDKASLIKGGFPASYGGRLSSVLDVKTKIGNLQNWQIRGALGILSSKLTIEAPLIKDRLSAVVAARRSYWDVFIKQNTNPEQVNSVPKYYYYDLNGRLYWKASTKNIFSLFAYTDQDKMYSTEIQAEKKTANTLYWHNRILGLTWEKFVNQHLNFSTTISQSYYSTNVNTQKTENSQYSEQDFTTYIQDITLQSTATYERANSTFKTGLWLSRRAYQPGVINYTINTDQYLLSNFNNSTLLEASVFQEINQKWSEKFRTNLGMRLNIYQTNQKSYFFPEPRLQFNYSADTSLSIKGSYSRMNQSIHLLTNPGLGIPLDLWVPSTARIKPQTADQLTLGLFYHPKFDKSLFFTLEGYYKNMNNIISYVDGKSSSDLINYSQDRNNQWEDVVTRGRGWAYGVEFLVEQNRGPITGWIGYTLSWVKHQFDDLNKGQWFYPRFDRRHDFSVVGAYQVNKRWSINASWVYSTGQPITLPVLAYNMPRFNFVNSSIPTSTYQIYSQGERNAFRMASFHRLDVSFQRKSRYRWGEGTLEFGLYNAYNRKNPYYYTLGVTNSRPVLKSVSLLPVIPTVSYNFTINMH
jgi:hypothetical protein